LSSSSPDFALRWLQSCLLGLPYCWHCEFQVVSHTQDHHATREPKRIEESIRNPNSPRGVDRQSRGLRENEPLELLHVLITEKRPTQGTREILECLLGPEPEAAISSGSRNEGLAVKLRLHQVPNLSWDCEPLLWIQRMLVLAKEEQGSPQS